MTSGDTNSTAGPGVTNSTAGPNPNPPPGPGDTNSTTGPGNTTITSPGNTNSTTGPGNTTDDSPGNTNSTTGPGNTTITSPGNTNSTTSPVGNTTTNGSSNCAPGFAGPTCTFCAAGYGGPYCSRCDQKSFSPGGNLQSLKTPCQAIPAKNAVLNSDRSGYTCTTGFVGVKCDLCAAGFGGSKCIACAAGKYSTGNNKGACKKCLARMAPNADSSGCICVEGAEAPTCNVCKAGYGSSKCARCARDGISGGGSLANCVKCARTHKPNDEQTLCVRK